jgi:penicillin-binding protein 2
MKCWHSNHGSVDVSTAIKKSCNGFFYRYANHTGIRNIQTVTSLLGLGRVTGVRITGEKPGNIPNPEWLRAKGLQWSEAFTALVAIGQGATECTPLQMASVTASVASGGKVYQPRLLKKVEEKNGDVVWEEPPTLKHDLTKEGITAEQLEIIKRGMWRVVNESGGTAGRARSKLTVLSGKTGTTQTGNPRQPTNAWFISFAPYDNPEIAVCVFVENGNSGGGAASPIARNIIENHFVMKEGKDVKMLALPSAVGNRDRVMSVSFDQDSKSLLAFVEQQAASEESAVDVDAFLPQSMKKRNFTPLTRTYTTPTIKKTVDSRGRVSSLNARPKPKFQPFRNLFQRRTR